MRLIIPDIQWQQEDLTNNSNMISFIQNLKDKGLISARTILPMVGLDPDVEKANLETEREMKKAKVQLQNEISDMAMLMAEKIVEREINKDDHEKLIKDFISQNES